jgi:hypothetical protein
MVTSNRLLPPREMTELSTASAYDIPCGQPQARSGVPDPWLGVIGVAVFLSERRGSVLSLEEGMESRTAAAKHE